MNFQVHRIRVFDVSFESPKHEMTTADQLFPPLKDEKRKKTRSTRCKSPTQVFFSLQ